MIADCNYGGHIADEWDRRCLATLVEQFLMQKPDFINTSLLLENLPNDGKYESFLTHIKRIPHHDGPATDFGLHANAEISRDMNESNEFLKCIESFERKAEQSVERFSKSNNELIEAKVKEILSIVPFPLNWEKSDGEGAHSEDCINVILWQEISQYRELAATIRSDCLQILLAIEGKSMNSYHI